MSDRLHRVRALFDQLIDQPAAIRSELLAGADVDPALRAEVEALLAMVDRTDDRLGSTSGSAPRFGGADLIGQRLGAYDIVRLIGSGGMGSVYEGVRADDQFNKRVAIKLVQSGLDSATTIARFRRERQILATLEHPDIVTLLDGGVTPDGRPFLVMELVDGQPITSWCDARQLSIGQRIALFRQVTSAVQHAHGKLVIHRDLKPGNILVTADGTAKLLDFGIAKLLSDPGDDEMPLTRDETRAFTPEYASPEQIRNGRLGTASDIYSLGVVLYELLTGRRPHRFAGLSLDAIERAVLEPAPRPSAVASDEAALLRRERDGRRLAKRLHGELDTVVMRALEPDPDRRYPSVEAFGDDLRRYLGGLPVVARGSSTAYRVGKFIRRNMAVVTTSVLVLASLVGGTVATWIEAQRARSAQITTERVNRFLTSILSSVKPETGGQDLPVSVVLDSAARRMSELADDPATSAEVEAVIGMSYASLGGYRTAEQHFRTRLALQRRLFGDPSPEVARTLGQIAGSLIDQGEIERADTVYHQAIAMARSQRSTPDTVLTSLLEGLGSVAHGEGKPALAEQFHREVLARRRRELGDSSDRVARAMNNLAVALGEQGKWAAAESLHRGAIARFRSNHPGPNPDVAEAEAALASALDLEGKDAAAESAFVASLAARKQLLGTAHPAYNWTLFNYAMFTFARGRYAEATELSRQVLANRGKSLPDTHPAVPAALQTLGRSLDLSGDHAGAERALRESLDLRLRSLPAGHWLVASSKRVLAEHYIAIGQYRDAEDWGLAAYRELTQSLGPTHANTRLAAKTLVSLYEASHNAAKAAEWGRRARAE